MTIKNISGTSLVVYWLRLRAPQAGGLGSIPGQGTRSHIPQLRNPHTQLKILHAATKTQQSQTSIKKKTKMSLDIAKAVWEGKPTLYLLLRSTHQPS